MRALRRYLRRSKRLRVHLLLTAIAALAFSMSLRAGQLAALTPPDALTVGIAYAPDLAAKLPAQLHAYEDTLQSEGVSIATVSLDDLGLIDGAELARRFRAIVLPDGLASNLTGRMPAILESYVRAGGHLAVIYDAGARDRGGAFLRHARLAALSGLEYQRYDLARAGAYYTGPLRFHDHATALRWRFPPGKIAADGSLTGYQYGTLRYPLASARRVAGDVEIAARTGDEISLAVRHVGRGSVLWAAMPLGAVKAAGDDLPLRATLRHFILDEARIPHLVALPDAVPRLILDWHIDSSVEQRTIPEVIRRGYVRKTLPMEFDVTAGPDRDRTGDHLGFDACGKGRVQLQSLLPYGAVGSHGGWAHNQFAHGVEDGTLTPAQIERMVQRNTACLESVTGRPIVGYSAPDGANPQPLTAQLMTRLHIPGYYYTGDTGAPPNLTYSAGTRTSNTVRAFPIMPNGANASLAEMERAGVSEADVAAWLDDTLSYVERERTTILVYSHLYDLVRTRYGAVYARFLDRLEADVRRGAVVTANIGESAAYLNRTQRTQMLVTAHGRRLEVQLANAEGLRGISFAIPSRWTASAPPEGLVAHGETSGYTYYTIARSGNTWAGSFALSSAL